MEFYIYFMIFVAIVIVAVVIKLKNTDVISGTDLYNENIDKLNLKDK